MALMFLNGGAMRGEPLHHHLGGAPLVKVTSTAPKYRFYSVDDAFPALHPVAHGGVEVSGELYDVPLETLRDHVLPSEPPELELGVVELADGGSSFAMVLRRAFVPNARLTDISDIGDWRTYIARKGRA